MLRTAYLAVALALVACGDDLENETLIGATCEETEDCDEGGGVCITSSRDGMCSMMCEHPGAAQECPLDSYCDTVDVETAKYPKSDMTLCLPACTAQSDCRSGYECSEVSTGKGKVCKPKDE